MSDGQLSDGDVKAIVDELECRLTKRFYFNIGQGIWALAWRAIIVMIVALSAYGALRGTGGLPALLK